MTNNSRNILKWILDRKIHLVIFVSASISIIFWSEGIGQTVMTWYVLIYYGLIYSSFNYKREKLYFLILLSLALVSMLVWCFLQYFYETLVTLEFIFGILLQYPIVKDLYRNKIVEKSYRDLNAYLLIFPVFIHRIKEQIFNAFDSHENR